MIQHRNPIVALWSHPRSMSTATERLMRERGDLDCAHEPFMYEYYVNRKAREMPHFEVRADHPVTYEEIRDWLLARAEKRPVFFKDMSYYVVDQILRDAPFRDRLRHGFLIRNPTAAIVSYYKLDPELSAEEIGLVAQWKMYQGLVAAGLDPVVIRSEDIRDDPRGTMAAFWQAMGLPFVEHAFEWSETLPKDWEQVEEWHGSVTASRGIKPMAPDHLEKARAAFEAVAAEAPHLRGLLADHQAAYDQLSARAIGSA